LVGSRAGDPADLRTCTAASYLGLAPGLPVHGWNRAERVIHAPPQARHGPFTELRLAPNPTAAVFGLMLRRRCGSHQSIWQVFKDAQKAAIYRVEAPGVRIKDCNSDGRFAGGLLELRQQGELARQGLGLAQSRGRDAPSTAADVDAEGESAMSGAWTTLDAYFDAMVAAVELPDDSKIRSIRADWALVGSSPRLEALVADGSLRLVYVGRSRVRVGDLLRMRDACERRVGGRVALFLLREVAHDLFAVRRKRGLADWLKFATAVLGVLSGLGSLSWLLSKLLASLT
jgi:hypothetical protein